ncbi:MAG: peptidase C10, Streptopain [bacterium F082]|nr:MAG: peptidase C10, Streptopain [bacterium F082]KWW28069.1 MAG: peptidase C10, Streptopain [bacterium P201]
MKTRVFLMLFILIAVFDFGIAQSVTQQEAAQVAVKLMQAESRVSLTMDSVARTSILARNGNTLLYEVLFTNGSTVLLSGHKACPPILGVIFAEEDEPSTGLLSKLDSLPEAFQELINYYAEQISFSIDNSVPLYCQSQWDSLLYGNGHSRPDSLRRVSPLIKTKWGQSHSNDGRPNAYDSLSPGCGHYEHCNAGCVAVAMAQILRFWHEPQERPDRCLQYDWGNMPNKLIHGGNSNYDTERYAISKLIYDCGTSVNMQYCGGLSTCNTLESGAYTEDVATALKQFGYRNAYCVSKDTIDDAEWGALLRNNLDKGFPIQYRGRTSEDPQSSKGHSFICDGYKKPWFSTYKYHINWGWNGNPSGWYTLDNLLPDQYHSSYNYKHLAILNIHPTDCWEDIIMQCNRIFAGNEQKYYSAQNSFSNNYHNYVINSGASVHLQAGEEILLTDGFYAAEGSEFTAHIATCGNSRGESDFLSGLLDESEQQKHEIERKNQTSSSVSPSEVFIFPNPVAGTFSIRLGNSSEKVTSVEVFNMVGGMVLRQDNIQDNIDVSSLHKGMYLVRVKCGSGEVCYGKFIKEE